MNRSYCIIIAKCNFDTGLTGYTDPDATGRRWWYKVYAVDVAGVQSRLAEPASMIR